ncbi:MAG: hypothetical protein WCI63_03820 [bacterium]
MPTIAQKTNNGICDILIKISSFKIVLIASGKPDLAKPQTELATE